MLVYFADGTSGNKTVYAYVGACLAGQPTAYVVRNGSLVWVKRKNIDCACDDCQKTWVEVEQE